jgi:hypothetical protein
MFGECACFSPAHPLLSCALHHSKGSCIAWMCPNTV